MRQTVLNTLAAFCLTFTTQTTESRFFPGSFKKEMSVQSEPSACVCGEKYHNFRIDILTGLDLNCSNSLYLQVFL